MPVDAAKVQAIHAAAEAAKPGTWEHELATALADVKAKLDAAGSGKREPMFFDSTDLFRREYSSTPWLVTGLLTRGGVAVIGGEPKTAKTWLAIEIALAVATGTPACREFYAERGAAAYFFAEDLDKQVRNRLRALLAGRQRDAMPTGRLFVQPRGVFLDVLDDNHLAWVIASCRRFGALDLLVLDPLRDVHSGEEDKSDSMRDVMRRLRALGELLACTVVVTHHNAKATADTKSRRAGQRGRGSSAIHGSTDSGIYLGALASKVANTIRNVVDVEIKGARSAGRFLLDIALEDDAQGEAVRAEWTHTKPDAKSGLVELDDAKAERDAKDDEAVYKRVCELAAARKWSLLSRSQLRDAVPGVADQRARAAITRLIPDRLELRDIPEGDKVYKDRVVPVSP